jgi:hypothetical protein
MQGPNPTPLSASDRRKSLEIILANLQHTFDGQMAALGDLSTRAGVILGFDVTAIAAVAGLSGSSLRGDIPFVLPAVTIVLLSATLAALALTSRDISFGPKAEDIAGLTNLTPESILAMLVDPYKGTCIDNRAVLEERALQLNISTGLLLLGAATFLIGILLS